MIHQTILDEFNHFFQIRPYIGSGPLLEYEKVYDFLSQSLTRVEQETVKRCIEALPEKYDHVKQEINKEHERDKIWSCIECFEDFRYNLVLNQCIQVLENIKPIL